VGHVEQSDERFCFLSEKLCNEIYGRAQRFVNDLSAAPGEHLCKLWNNT